MKFTLAYYLLLIYATVILNPVIPIVKDGLSHCFAQAYHIATVHAIYGDNHIEKQMAGANDDSNSNTKNIIKEDGAASIHLSVLLYFTFKKITPFKTSYIQQPEFFLHKIFLNIVVPPPKFFL